MNPTDPTMFILGVGVGLILGIVYTKLVVGMIRREILKALSKDDEEDVDAWLDDPGWWKRDRNRRPLD